MTSIDNVQDITPRVQYTASASQTTFAYPFPIFEDSDLVVDVDGVTKTLTTDYTVTGAGADNGGNVVFGTALAGGEIVTIYRDISVARSTDFQQNGAWSSTSFNDELDRLTLVQQDLENKIGRAIRFPQTSTSTNTQAEMSPISSFLGKFLRISSAGILEAASVTDSVVTLTAEVIGALVYPRTAAEITAGITPTYYRYKPGHAHRFGAVGDDVTDDATAINNAIISADGGIATLDHGLTYRVESSIVCSAHFDLNGSQLHFVVTGAVKNVDMRSNSSIFNGSVVNEGSSPSGSGQYQCPILVGEYGNGTGYYNVHIHDLSIESNRSDGNGVMITGGSNSVIIDNVYFPDGADIGRPILAHWGNAGDATNGSTHPFDITIRNCRAGNMTSTSSAGALVFLSGVYNVSVIDCHVDDYDWEAIVIIFAGDYGNYYAPVDVRDLLMSGIEIVNVTGTTSRTASNGFKVDGLSTLAPQNKAAHGPTFRNCRARGAGTTSTDNGFTIQSCRGTILENCEVSEFANGVVTGIDVKRLQVIGGRYFQNAGRGLSFSNGSTPPEDCVIDRALAYSNGLGLSTTANIYIGTQYRTVVRNCVIGREAQSDTFVDGDVNTSTDRITLTAHDFEHGEPVTLTTSGTLPTGLATSTLYYVKVIDANTIELYSDLNLSSIVDITAAAGGGTHTITIFDPAWGLRVESNSVDAIVEGNYCHNATVVAYSLGSSTTYGLVKTFLNNTAASGITEYGGMVPTTLFTKVRGTTVIKHMLGTAAPASGTWVKGDFVENEDPDEGDPIGWSCTAGGTPGTWVVVGQVGYRTNAGTPVSALTPTFIGERVFDTANEDWYTATGTANTDWKQDSA